MQKSENVNSSEVNVIGSFTRNINSWNNLRNARNRLVFYEELFNDLTEKERVICPYESLEIFYSHNKYN